MTSLRTGQRQLTRNAAADQRRRQLAAQLQQQATSFAPIQHPYQGLAKLAQAWAGVQLNKRSDADEQEYETERAKRYAEALSPVREPLAQNVPSTGQIAPGDTVGVLAGMGQPNFGGELFRTQTIPERPQYQTPTQTMSQGRPRTREEMLQVLGPELGEPVLQQMLAQQFTQKNDKSADVLGRIDQSGQVFGHTAAIPGTQRYEALLQAGYFPVAKPSQGADTQPKALNFADSDGKIIDTAIVGSEKFNELVQKPGVFVAGPVSQVQRQETGGPNSFGRQDHAVQIKLNEQVAALDTFAKIADRTLGLINANPGANTLTAGLMNLGNRAVQEIKTLSREVFDRGNFTIISGDTGETITERGWDISHYEDVFSASGLAGVNPRIKNAFLSLAIQRAMASGLGTGRALSDYDIKNQLKTLGDNQSDPNIVRDVFSDSYHNILDYTESMANANPNISIQSELYTPSFFNPVKTVPVEEMPGWDELSPEDQAEFRRLNPNGYHEVYGR
jgi:hypothetical protein